MIYRPVGPPGGPPGPPGGPGPGPRPGPVPTVAPGPRVDNEKVDKSADSTTDVRSNFPETWIWSEAMTGYVY